MHVAGASMVLHSCRDGRNLRCCWREAINGGNPRAMDSRPVISERSDPQASHEAEVAPSGADKQAGLPARSRPRPETTTGGPIEFRPSASRRSRRRRSRRRRNRASTSSSRPDPGRERPAAAARGGVHPEIASRRHAAHHVGSSVAAEIKRGEDLVERVPCPSRPLRRNPQHPGRGRSSATGRRHRHEPCVASALPSPEKSPGLKIAVMWPQPVPTTGQPSQQPAPSPQLRGPAGPPRRAPSHPMPLARKCPAANAWFITALPDPIVDAPCHPGWPVGPCRSTIARRTCARARPPDRRPEECDRTPDLNPQ